MYIKTFFLLKPWKSIWEKHFSGHSPLWCLTDLILLSVCLKPLILVRPYLSKNTVLKVYPRNPKLTCCFFKHKQYQNCFIPCKGIQDSLGFWVPRHGFRILCTGFYSLSVKVGFWIPIASVIPDSLSCIPDSKTQDSRFHKQKIPGFRYMGRTEQTDCTCSVSWYHSSCWSHSLPAGVDWSWFDSVFYQIVTTR